MICTTLDDFVLEKDVAYWTAELNNGLIVYQDDGRPGYEEQSAWLRLKKYCETHNLFVRKMRITFRSHTELCGESDTGFFFSLGIFANCLVQRQQQRFICGPIKDGAIHITIWAVPEILSVETEIRDILGNEEKIICLHP